MQTHYNDALLFMANSIKIKAKVFVLRRPALILMILIEIKTNTPRRQYILFLYLVQCYIWPANPLF